MGKHKNRFRYDSLNLVQYIWSKRRVFFWVGVLAFTISVIASLMIRPKFQSSVVMFPASSASISKSLLSPDASRQDILEFGGQEEGEQLMQILLSSQIRDRIIRRFHLARHYGIDTTSGSWRARLSSEYNGNITFHRTEYMSIVIDVTDFSPDTAALIANAVSDEIDTVMNSVQHQRAIKAFVIVKKEYGDLQNEIRQIRDSIRRISEIGSIGFGKQSIPYHEAYAKAIANGKTEGMHTLQHKLHLIAKYGGTYDMLTRLLNDETKRLSGLNERFMEAKVDAEQFIPHKFVIDKAYKSDRKYSPKRSLIVLVSTLSALFLAFLILLIQDSLKYTKD